MPNVKGNSSVSLAFTQDLSYGINQLQTLPVPLSLRSQMKTSGVLLDQCDLVSEFTLSFSASTPQVIDLTNLTGPGNNAVNLARVRVFACRVNSTTDGQVLLLGANGTNDWLGLSSTGSTVSVYASTAANDGFALFQMPNTTGAAVGATTKLLKCNPGANAFTVDFLIAGCSA